MSGLKHLALLKHIARYLVDKQECAWQFSEQKPPTKIVAFTDADWASNDEDRRSVDTVHLFFGRALLETSTCTQQVSALSSGESEFYGVLRSSACALQIRQLLLDMNIEMGVEILPDSSAARGMVRRSGSGRVKHLEVRWLWLQEQTREKELHVGTVDTAHNSSDLGTKFHPRRRFEELLMMLPLKIGVGLISSYGAEGLSKDRADGENRDVSPTGYLSVRGGSLVVWSNEEVMVRALLSELDFDTLQVNQKCAATTLRAAQGGCLKEISSAWKARVRL